MRRTCRLVVTVAAALVFVSSLPAAAQGRGRGLTKKGGGASTTVPATVSGTTTVSQAGGYRQFGSWLDDASLLQPGTAWTALSFSHTRVAGSHQNDFPVVDVSLGLTRRAQFNLTVPYYRLHFLDGTAATGIGDIYANVKLGLIEPGGSGNFGLALTPLIEILDAPAPGASRVSWGAPVSLEYRTGDYRVFGSTGYFSRGAVFGSGAVEASVTDSLLVTTTFSFTRSTRDDVLADALGLSRGHGDISALAAYFLNSSVAVFGGVGRSLLGSSSSGTTSTTVTAGVSLSVIPRTSRP